MNSACVTFSIELLGPFRLFGPDGERIGVSSKKGMALLALLAMSPGGERTRSWLQDKLWGSRQQLQAQSSLRREVSTLRQLLNTSERQLIIADHDRIMLNLEFAQVDARDIRAAGARPTEDHLNTGEFLEGLDISGEDAFEDWLREQRRALATLASSGPAAIKPATKTDAQALPVSVLDMSQPAPGFDGTPALAVLPFQNLTGNPDNEFLSQGISEDLIDRLSRLRWLPVISRSSSFAFGSGDVDLAALRQNLGIKYLLEGRLRSAEQGFGLSVTLSEADTGRVIWSSRADLPAHQTQDALSDLMAGIVSVLDTRIDHAEQVRAHTKPQSDLNVNELIWRGRWHLHRLTKADSEMAQRLFAEALAREPNSPEALIQSAWSIVWSAWAQRKSDADIMAVRALAQRAMVADCDDGRAHWLTGVLECWLRQPERSKASLRQSILLNPSLSQSHAQLGTTHYLAGEPERALAPLKIALRLSPNDKQVFGTLGEMAMAHLVLGNWHEAIEHADLSLVRRPAYWYAHMTKICALVQLGDRITAKNAYADLLAVSPKFTIDHIDWVPFVDPIWTSFLKEGVATAQDELAAG
jgi:TolB-like protein/Flp pilus assembly protein TadD